MRTWRLKVLATGLLLAALSGASAANAQESFSAGFRLLTTTYDGVPMRMALWYPAREPETGVAVGPFTLRAARDAEPADGRFGLIVISHGSGGGALNHRDTARELARAGFVAAAIHHPGDNWQNQSRSGTRQLWQERPAHLSAAIDAALRDDVLGLRIDPGRIGAMGHSFGGYTVLAAAGAHPVFSELVTHCDILRERDPVFCGYRRQSGSDAEEPAELQVQPDPRVRAVVALAPIGAIFSESSFARIRARLRLYRAGRDTILRAPFHAERIARYLDSRHQYVVLPDAGHFTFIAPFPEALRASAGPAATDPPGTNRAAVHERLNREIVAFFRDALPVSGRR